MNGAPHPQNIQTSLCLAIWSREAGIRTLGGEEDLFRQGGCSSVGHNRIKGGPIQTWTLEELGVLKEYSRKVVPVTRMDCPSCVATIEKELKKLNGVVEARVNFLMRRIVVTYDPDRIDVPTIEKRIEDLGYYISYKKYESPFDKIQGFFRRKEEVGFRRVSDHNFRELVIEARKPSVVIFFSPECPSCRVLRPILRDVCERFRDKVYVYEMNIIGAKTWEEYGVMSVPTLLYFGNGKEVSRLVGLLKENELEDFMARALSS